MQRQAVHIPFPLPETEAPEVSPRLTILAERLARTIGVARALAQRGRTVDLNGIQDGVGMLCAQTLDLPLSHGRLMLPMLRDVVTQVDALMAVLQTGKAGCRT